MQGFWQRGSKTDNTQGIFEFCLHGQIHAIHDKRPRRLSIEFQDLIALGPGYHKWLAKAHIAVMNSHGHV
jgi:hypothetical protein